MLVASWEAVRKHLSAHERLVLAWPVARTARQWLGWLSGMGLEPPLILALYDGDGEALSLPQDLVHTMYPGQQLPDDGGTFPHYQEVMRALPARLQAALDRFDPHRQARVIVPCAAELTAVGGRAVLGPTSAARRLLEDKLRVDALWDQLGVARLPSTTVPLADAESAHAELDRGEGTVWAGDNTSGIEAGAVATRHVFDRTSLRAAMDVLEGRCRKVRVQPFVNGTPCSIQGIVLDDGTALTRPCEMLVLRDPSTGSFALLGVANTWDPPAAVTEALSELAHRTGHHLRLQHDWRGGFSVDAIATVTGEVWPTEINARMTAGLALLDGVLPEPPLELVERVLREGGDIALDAPRLQHWIQSTSRHRRFCHARLNHVRPPEAPHKEVRIGDILDDQSASVTWSATGSTGRLDITFNPFRTQPGARIAPRLAAALRIAQASWKLDLPSYVAGGVGPVGGLSGAGPPRQR